MLKKYDSVYDFIIFGSSTKDKMIPADFDVAAVMASKSASLIGEIKTELDKFIPNVHLEIITYADFVNSKLPYYALLEGFSVKAGQFLSKKFKILRKVLYMFSLEGLTQTKKVMFNKALRSILERTKAEKIGKGSLLVGSASSGEFEDFFNQWGIKIRKKELIEI